jgi:enoyl-CoA hydratase
MTDEILFAQEGPIARITFNRPEVGNSFTDSMVAQLTQLIGNVSGSTNAVLLDAKGRDFSIGRDAMHHLPAVRPEAMARRHQGEFVFDCYEAFRRCPVPIVAVVQGRAAGFGCALSALADITLAGDSATFQVREMDVGIMPAALMSAFVDRVPQKVIAYLVYSRGVVDAPRAVAMGIASKLVPDSRLGEETNALCCSLGNTPRVALRAVKEYLRSAASMPIQGAVDFARNLHATVNSSSEMDKREK